MRTKHLSVRYWITLPAVILTACSSLVSTTEYKEWSSDKVYVGSGGTRRTVEGIDIWENGEPDRKFRVLGIIEDSTLENTGAAPNTLNVLSVLSTVSLAKREKRLIEEARKHNGDAIIYFVMKRDYLGASDYETNFRNQVKVFVIKYVNDRRRSSWWDWFRFR